MRNSYETRTLTHIYLFLSHWHEAKIEQIEFLSNELRDEGK